MADEQTGQSAGDQTAGTGANVTDEKLTLTKAELLAQLQSEGDRRVQQATAKIREQAEKDAATRAEAERAAAEQRLLEEQGKFKELADKHAAENERLKQGIKASQLMASTHSACAEAGLPDFAKVFAGDLGTIEGRTALLDVAKGLIAAQVEAQVAERLKTDPLPKGAGGGKLKDGASAEDFYAKPTV